VYENEGVVKVGLELPEEILTIEQYGRTIFGDKLDGFKVQMHNKHLSPAYLKLFDQIYADLLDLSEILHETTSKA